MKKQLSLLAMCLIVGNSVNAQNYSINQNQQTVQQNVNINLPVIEKTVYVDRYRTVYVDRPTPKRIARKLDKPLCLLGYLWVYPEDLGNFKQPPHQIIENLNKMNSYGHNNWRIPTPEELAVLEANADKVGLGDDIYLATDHCNGVLRLVARPETAEEQAEREGGILIGSVIWAKMDVGASRVGGEGMEFYIDDAIKSCPKGWTLPTENDFNSLFKSGRTGELKFQSYYWNGEGVKYWTSSKYIDTSFTPQTYRFVTACPIFQSTHGYLGGSYYVRCVKHLGR